MNGPVLLAGATGLVGGLLADRLLAQGATVHALVRRATGRSAASWHEHVAPREEWPDLARRHAGAVAISALGTTWRAAGSEAAFRAVDQDLVLAFARAAHEGGAQHFIAVSSVGADPYSRNFYLRVKGEVEEALAAIGFARLDIVRPGLLRGPRGGERRIGERVGIAVSPIANLVLRGSLDRFAAIDAATVAEAMAHLLQEQETGLFVHHNRALRNLASIA